MTKSLANTKLIFTPYILWVGIIIATAIWSISHLSFTPNFPYYHDISHYGRAIASFAHFDGIHYLRLVQKGYDDTGSQAFFPFYPFLIRLLSFRYFDPLYVAILLNTIAVFGTLYLTSLSLASIQFKRFAYLFLSLPTSFFLLGNYTESIFIFMVTLFFHLLSKKRYLLSGIVAGLASMTRLVGIFLALSLVIELIRAKKLTVSTLFITLISVSGLAGYMYYLYSHFGDSLMFVHVQSLFNNGRSSGNIISLPQVLFRYLKIFLTVSPMTILFVRALWEFITFSTSMFALYYYRNKLRSSALIFCLCALILPTFSGTLSSYPRYLLVAVPLFVAVAKYLPGWAYRITVLAQCAILIVSVALFVQGIFVA